MDSYYSGFQIKFNPSVYIIFLIILVFFLILNGELYVNTNKLNVLSIDIYNLTGEKLYSKKVNQEQEFVLKLHNLTRSIYLLKLTTDTGFFGKLFKLN